MKSDIEIKLEWVWYDDLGKPPVLRGELKTRTSHKYLYARVREGDWIQGVTPEQYAQIVEEGFREILRAIPIRDLAPAQESFQKKEEAG